MGKLKSTPRKLIDGFQPRDLFQTPRYATELLIPFIPKHIDFIWECACGEGRIVDVLEEHGYIVYATDIRHNDYTDDTLNFITDEPPLDDLIPITTSNEHAIITNPPFSVKEKFIEQCFNYNIPFALLINADYSLQMINWIQRGCEKIIPTRRIDFITPTGLSGLSGHTASFHSFWLTRYFNLGRTETFVELTLEQKKNV